MSVPSNTPDGASTAPPPIDIGAVRRAREIASDPAARLATVEELRGLLAAYDALAARMAWMAANMTGDVTR